MVLEMQKSFLNTQMQALTFQNNMKLQSPPAYTLIFLSTLNPWWYCAYLHAFLVDAIAQVFSSTFETLFSA